MITGMGIYGKHSILGANVKHLTAKFEMSGNFIEDKWKSSCQDQGDIIRTSEQIKELCFMRDTHYIDILTRSEATSVIHWLCTSPSME